MATCCKAEAITPAPLAHQNSFSALEKALYGKSWVNSLPMDFLFLIPHGDVCGFGGSLCDFGLWSRVARI